MPSSSNPNAVEGGSQAPWGQPRDAKSPRPATSCEDVAAGGCGGGVQDVDQEFPSQWRGLDLPRQKVSSWRVSNGGGTYKWMPFSGWFGIFCFTSSSRALSQVKAVNRRLPGGKEAPSPFPRKVFRGPFVLGLSPAFLWHYLSKVVPCGVRNHLSFHLHTPPPPQPGFRDKEISPVGASSVLDLPTWLFRAELYSCSPKASLSHTRRFASYRSCFLYF